MSKDWKEFHAISAKAEPAWLAVEALKFVAAKEAALDIGAGSLRDSRYFLEQGFRTVTAMDMSPALQDYAKDIKDEGFRAVVSSFADFAYPERTYDLVYAKASLPFNPPETFDAMFARVKEAVKPGGILAVNFFGPHDAFNTPGSGMTFHTREQVEAMLEGFDLVIPLHEVDREQPSMNGELKHWHIFTVIARRAV